MTIPRMTCRSASLQPQGRKQDLTEVELDAHTTGGVPATHMHAELNLTETVTFV